MTEFEIIRFSGGVNIKKNPILLGENELVSCDDFEFKYEGKLVARDPITNKGTAIYHPYHTTLALSGINGIYKSKDYVLLCSKEPCAGSQTYFNYLFYRTAVGSAYSHVDILNGDERPKFLEYKNFVFIQDERDHRMFCNGYTYKFLFPPPDFAPSVTSGGSGSLDGAYLCRFTHYYQFANGEVYETAPSPITTVTASAEGYLLWGSGGGFSTKIDTACKLLLHMDGSDEGTTFTDSGHTIHTVTAKNEANTETDYKKFGTASCQLDGTDDYLEIPDHDDFYMGDGRFTIDFWARFDSAAVNAGFFGQRSDDLNYISFHWVTTGSGTLRFVVYDETSPGVSTLNLYIVATGWTPNINTWYHIALIRGWENDNDKYAICVNGVALATTTYVNGEWINSTGTFEIGRAYYFPATDYYDLDGYIDEFRIIKGRAQWTSGFTPPASAYNIESFDLPTSILTPDATIYKRLYRTIGDGSTYYLVGTYNMYPQEDDNIYDSISDTNLQNNSVMLSMYYDDPPLNCSDMEIHLNRLIFTKGTKLYYSEAYIPQAFDPDNYLTLTEGEEIIIGGASWMDQFYIVTKAKWYRLQGTDSDVWGLKHTFSDTGIINRNTMAKTKYGILGLWYDGIYLFDGQSARNITQHVLGEQFFLDLDDYDLAYASWDGTRYYFYYSSDGSNIDSCYVLDFSYWPKIRCYGEYGSIIARTYDSFSGAHLLCTASRETQLSGTENISASLQTGDKVFKNIAKRKNLRYLYYDLDSGGYDVTVTIYVDGTSTHTITLSPSSRVRKRTEKLPQTCEGYRFSLGISTSYAESVTIYEPWLLEATLVGE